MLEDMVRTSRTLWVILKVEKPSDIVLNLGAGIGILSNFACIAGPSRVQVIEQVILGYVIDATNA
jgi:predicted RNA methylase